MKYLILLLIVLLCGCSQDLSEVQASFVCSNNGGVYQEYIFSVRCNNGTIHEHRDIELPEALWMNN